MPTDEKKEATATQSPVARELPLDNLAAALPALRRPFTHAAVKFKPLTKPYDGRSSAAFYIDARLVAERLNTVVGPENWSDDYNLIADGIATPALYYPVVCRLTTFGVTKTDVGQGANTVVDEKAWKSAYSDALKRAAVKFGIGAYLYAIPRLYAPVDIGNDGKAKGFTKDGKAYLLERYRGWLASPLNTFGDPLDHGDIADEDDDASASDGNAASNGRAAEPKAPAALVTEIETLIAALNETGALGEVEIRDGMHAAYGTHLTAELTASQAANLKTRLAAKAAEGVPA